MYYIQENDKPTRILKLFNYIKAKNDILILPITDENIKIKKAQKLAKKTSDIIKFSNCKKIVLSKQIEKQENFLNCLYEYDIDIVDGKWLFGILIYDVLEYIIKKQHIQKESIKISLTVNQITDNVIYFIKMIVKEYKTINIVTNHTELFKKLENKIMEDYGIMIVLTNNKKKSLSKSNIIINFDFPNEIINKYYIYQDAIIVNLQGNVKIENKKFNGLNINDYEIQITNSDFLDYEKRDKYKEKFLYEAELNKKQPVEEVIKKIRKDKVEIKNLIGKNNIL